MTYSPYPNTTWLSLHQQPPPHTPHPSAPSTFPLPAPPPPDDSTSSSSPSDSLVTFPHHAPNIQTDENQMCAGTPNCDTHTPTSNTLFNYHPFQKQTTTPTSMAHSAYADLLLVLSFCIDAAGSRNAYLQKYTLLLSSSSSFHQTNHHHLTHTATNTPLTHGLTCNR